MTVLAPLLNGSHRRPIGKGRYSYQNGSHRRPIGKGRYSYQTSASLVGMVYWTIITSDWLRAELSCG